MVGAVYILVVIVVLERKIVVGKLIQDNHHLIDYHPNTWTSAGFMVD
jgi:hypothetical protein